MTVNVRAERQIERNEKSMRPTLVYIVNDVMLITTLWIDAPNDLSALDILSQGKFYKQLRERHHANRW